MSSPKAKGIAIVFMEHIDQDAIDTAPDKPSACYISVDDTIIISRHGNNLHQIFLEHINSIHPNIQFTMEIKSKACLSHFYVMRLLGYL